MPSSTDLFFVCLILWNMLQHVFLLREKDCFKSKANIKSLRCAFVFKWSFGIVLWELLTRGMNPYPTVDNWDMMRYLKDGRRLSKPEFCPEGM